MRELVGIEHCNIRLSNDGKVGSGTSLGRDKDSVSLGRGDVDLVSGVRDGINTINLNHGHLMLIKLKPKRRECRSADDVEEVRLSCRYIEAGILNFVDQERIWNGLCTTIGIVVVC